MLFLTDVQAFFSSSYVSVSLASFLGNLLVFFPAPYLLPVAIASLDPAVNLGALTLSGAASSALGKLVVFRASYTGRRLVSKGTRKRMKPFERLVSRYGWLAALIAAATPVPDDLIFIPLGFARYTTWKFFLATLTGKAIIVGAVAFGARYSIPVLDLLIGEDADPGRRILLLVLFAAVGVGVMLAIVRIDWAPLLGRWFPWTLEENSDTTKG